MKPTTLKILFCAILTGVCMWGCLPPMHTEAVGSSSPRSSRWPAVRAAFIKQNPSCAACGRNRPLQVHHMIPFSSDADGDVDGDGITNELDHDNLITLCNGDTCNCHLWIGHAGNWNHYNPNVRDDAARFRVMITGRKPNQ